MTATWRCAITATSRTASRCGVRSKTKGAIFHSNSDTEVLMHLIRRSMRSGITDKLQEALNTVHGGFAYLT